MTSRPSDASSPVDTPSNRQRSPRRAFTLAELLAVIAVIAILVALLLPITRSAAPAARRSRCINNIKQIGLGLRAYESVYKALPPAYTVDAAGRPLHSWRTLILPYVDQERLYETIDLSKPWNDPANARAYAAAPSLYRCPELTSSATSTPYLAIVGHASCFLPDEPRCLSEITDEHRLTLMVIEAPADQAVHWMAPIDASESLVLGVSPRSKLNHAGGMTAAFVDASARFLRAKDTTAEHRARISIAANDDIAARGTD